MAEETKEVRLFLSYARNDHDKVEKLYQDLADAGFKPWMDTKDILPGEDWRKALNKAISEAHFFLACLSNNSVNKRGIIQDEIKAALETWRQKLEDDIYLIPVRLEKCEAPESLARFQWVDLFKPGGLERLIRALKVGMERLGISQSILVPQNKTKEAPHTIIEPTSTRTIEDRDKVLDRNNENDDSILLPNETKADLDTQQKAQKVERQAVATVIVRWLGDRHGEDLLDAGVRSDAVVFVYCDGKNVGQIKGAEREIRFNAIVGRHLLRIEYQYETDYWNGVDSWSERISVSQTSNEVNIDLDLATFHFECGQVSRPTETFVQKFLDFIGPTKIWVYLRLSKVEVGSTKVIIPNHK